MNKLNNLLSISFMILLSIILSYYLTWNSMLDNNKNYNHLNRVYHSLLMGFLMGAIETCMIILMGQYELYLYILLSILILLSIISYMLIRKQTLINEDEFYKGMIQHHESALFMAKRVLQRNDISDYLKKLAVNIIKSQTQEIQDMKAKLNNIKMNL